jgi:hypothetical protein
MFGVQVTSMKKLSVFGAFRFSEFWIKDCVPVLILALLCNISAYMITQAVE